MEYKKEQSKFYDRKSVFDANIPKVYSTTFCEYCTCTMQLLIEVLWTFKFTVKNDLIKLIKAIQTLMHEPTRAKYPYTTMMEVMLHFLNMTQHEKEGLID